jgi:hypothetical protein
MMRAGMQPARERLMDIENTLRRHRVTSARDQCLTYEELTTSESKNHAYIKFRQR